MKFHYEIKFDADELFKIDTVVRMRGSKKEGGLDALGEGLKSIYILSLLQTYVDTKNTAPYIIMVDTPEIYLHPQLKRLRVKSFTGCPKRIRLYFPRTSRRCCLTLHRDRSVRCIPTAGTIRVYVKTPT